MLSHSAFAQFYPAKIYSIRDGMPTNSIFDITQCDDGIMWFMTAKGVATYNSLNWSLFADSLKLPNSEFSYIKGIDDGSIWVAGQNSTNFVIKYFSDQKWHDFKVENLPELEEKFSFDVKATENGHSVILCDNNSAYQDKTETKEFKRIIVSEAKGFHINAVELKGNKAYLSTTDGLLVLDEEVNPHPVNEQINKNKEVFKIHWKNEALYLLGKGWLGIYKDGEFNYLSTNTGVTERSRFNKHNLTIDQFDRIFYSSVSSAKYLDRTSGNSKTLYVNGRVFNALTNKIYVDNENNVWVGDHRGLFKVNVLRFQNYNGNTGLAQVEVTAILPSNDGLVLANESNLNFLVKGEIIKQVSLGLEKGIRVLDMTETLSGQLYIAANTAGLIRYDGHDLKTIDLKLSPGANVVTSVESFGDSLFFSTNKGLYSIINGEIKKEITTPYVRNISRFKQDHEVALSTSEGLYIYSLNTKEVIHYTSQNRIYNSVYGICKWNGKYFIGTTGGLATIKNGKIIPYLTEEKMNRVAVYSLFVSKNNQLWMGTNEGVFIWDGEKMVNYNRGYGLVGDEINRNAFLQTDQDEIWIGTEMGASVYKFDQDISLSITPQLQLRTISTIDGTVLSEENQELDYDDNTLDFNFLGISYFDEKQINYRYKLLGFDSDWIYINNPNSNSVRYTNLPAGEYTFIVQSGLSKNNTWGKAKSRSFIIKKPFYTTYWFILLCVLTTGIILYSIYRIRLNFILENQKKLKRKVHIRTHEIQRMNKEIQTQNEELIAQGEIIGTYNEKLEETVHERTLKLSAQNEKLSKYAFMNSHELRAPICRLMGLLNLLKVSENEDHPKILILIQETGMELDLVTKNINQILDNVDLSKLEEASSIEAINAELRNRKKDNLAD